MSTGMGAAGVPGEPLEWGIDEVVEWAKRRGFGPDIYEKFLGEYEADRPRSACELEAELSSPARPPSRRARDHRRCASRAGHQPSQGNRHHRLWQATQGRVRHRRPPSSVAAPAVWSRVGPLAVDLAPSAESVVSQPAAVVWWTGQRQQRDPLARVCVCRLPATSAAAVHEPRVSQGRVWRGTIQPERRCRRSRTWRTK